MDENYSSDSSSTISEDCNDFGNFNGSVFEEVQRNTYKELPRNVYCDLIGTLETQCFEQSLLEIWMYNEKIINKLNVRFFRKNVRAIFSREFG